MDNNNQLGKNVMALMLFIALMLPTTVDFFHMFENHEHPSCTEQSLHIHETIVSCDVCDYHLVSSNFDVASYPDFRLPLILTNEESSYVSLELRSYTLTNTRLRAPPSYS